MVRCFSKALCAVVALLVTWLIGPGASAGVTILNDGANGRSALIRIQSAITKGDLQNFEAALDAVERTAKTRINDTPFVTVELNSPGGDVVEAIGIGRAIYQHSAMTLVRPAQECVSACVFILMAGAVHTPTGALIGVHRPLLVSWHNMSYREARAKYDGLMRYLHDYFLELGVSEAAYDIMMRTDSGDMRYFDWSELDQLGLRGEGPGWRARFAERQAERSRQGWTTVDAPSLPKIDEAYREVVFMPGDLSGKDYYAGVSIQRSPFAWDSIDMDVQRLAWDSPDITAWLARFYHAVWDVLEPGWWLLVVLIFELLRGNSAAWPDHPTRRRRDQWRLAPFRPAAVSPASAPVPDRA
jgi:hypothetical protein